MKQLLSIIFALIISGTIYAADYAKISGKELIEYHQICTQMQLTFDYSKAKINGVPYKQYLESLDAKQKAQYDKELSQLTDRIIKRFNKVNKKSFQLTTATTDYIAEIKVEHLNYSLKKGRAVFTGVIDIKPSQTNVALTHITLTEFGGARKNNPRAQKEQLAYDIIEYLSIYLNQ